MEPARATPWVVPDNQVVYTLTEHDTIKAYQLAAPIRSIRLAIASVGALVAIGLIGQIYRFSLIGFVALAIGMFLLVGLLSWLRWAVLLPRRIRRIYDQQLSLQDEHIVAWTQSGLQVSTEHGRMKLPWSRIRKRRQNATTILLYQSDVMFHAIPKRVLSPEQLASLETAMEPVPLRQR